VRAEHPGGLVKRTSAFAYDDAARLIRAEVTKGAMSLDSFRVSYDARGRRALTQITATPDWPVLHLFDAGDRLREARRGLQLAPLGDEPSPAAQVASIPPATAAAKRVERYDVDAADTRRAVTVEVPGSPPTTLAYVIGPGGRLDAVNAQPIGHHIDGPRSADASRLYDIDALGRIVRIRDSAGSVRLEVEYDPLSRPAGGTELGETFRRWFVGAKWVHEARGAAGSIRQSTPHPTEPLPMSVRGPGGVVFLHDDGGQSSLCVTDGTGALVQRHRQSPFGTPEVFGPAGSPLALSSAIGLTWRGMALRSSTGLYESQSRLYDPAVGAFLARDPYLYADSPSPYAFAGHDPVNHSDPTGRDKHALGEKSWIQTPEDTPEDKAKRRLMLDEPPNPLMMLMNPGELVYGMLFGIKQEIYKPIKAQFLNERPKYLDAHQNVQTVPWKPDRSAQLAVAWGNLAIIPLSSEKFMAQMSIESILEMRAGEIWGPISYHDGFGPVRGTYFSSIALTRGPIAGEEITVITTNNWEAHQLLENAIAEGRIVLEPGERLGAFRWQGSKGMHSERSGILTHQDLGGSEGYVWTNPDCCFVCEDWIDANARGYVHLNPPSLRRLESAARSFRF
jgi:RHS repeat-associated protein